MATSEKVRPPITVHVVSHTHWDREWYLPAGRFRQRLVALVDELLEHPDAGGQPFLLDGQAVILDDYLAVRPERRSALAHQLQQGALDAGPWYVLSDELIPSGEALVRNLLAGREALRLLGAVPPPVLYSPDAFGHPAALPAIAAGFGLPLIILWRGFGGPAWPPGDCVRWSSPNGSEVLLYHLPRSGYEFGSALPTSPDQAVERWRTIREELGARSALGVVLLPNGADHHARQRDLGSALEALRLASGGDPIVPSSLRRFAAALAERAETVDLPRIEGELRHSYGYCWSLQGTFATRAAQKRRNAQIERLLLTEAEPWSALASRLSRSRRPVVKAAWRSLLLCHPHDTLCGCSTDEVARAMDARLDDAASQGHGIVEDALLELVGHDREAARGAPHLWKPVLLLRNPAARARRGVAEVELLRFSTHVPVGPGSARRRDQAPQPDPPTLPFFHQPLEDGIRYDRVDSPRHYPAADLVHSRRALLWVQSIAGYGTLAFPLELASAGGEPPARDSVRRLHEGIGNGVIDLLVTDGGTLALRDAASGLRISPVVRFEDVGDAGDLYTHSPVSPTIETIRPQSTQLSVSSPLRGVINSRWTLAVREAGDRTGRTPASLPVEIRLSCEIDAGAPFLRMRIAGDNRARDHRLRVVVGTGIERASVHADAAFASIFRAPIVVSPQDASAELPPPTAPLHRYVTVSNESRGVTVISDGLAEYEVLPGGDIAITLCRAVGELSRPDLPERPGHAGWPAPTPEAQSQGPFEAMLAIYPHGPRERETIVAIEHVAEDVLIPITGGTIRSALQVPIPTGGLALEGEALVFSTLKESEDGEWLVLRCRNLVERATTGVWRLGFDVSEARSARLDETPGDTLELDGRSVRFPVPSLGIATVLVR
ncbi:MAG: hypothetical protein M3068_05230 [Gemmatimonadota bacterium]|nr:hypothetical protein [Gemmatimonadota bacterium]